MFSVMIRPPINWPMSRATIVTIGISALRTLWRHITRLSGMPLERAVRKKSDDETSSTDARV